VWKIQNCDGTRPQGENTFRNFEFSTPDPERAVPMKIATPD